MVQPPRTPAPLLSSDMRDAQAGCRDDAGRMVVLVPRQLRFTGMTGNVPYYGGRFTPAQAYAAAHPQPSAPPPPSPSRPRRDPREALEALAHLRDTGVLDEQEYEQLRTRILP